MSDPRRELCGYRTARSGARARCRENHARQTVAFVRRKRAECLPLGRVLTGFVHDWLPPVLQW